MTAAYALVLPGRHASEQESAPGVDCEPGKLVLQRHPHSTERRAG
jgi:hypothetical protein